MKHLLVIFLITLVACQGPEKQSRIQLNLAGEWQFALDSSAIGETENWYSTDLPEHVQLPGTTDENHQGWLNTDTTTSHLNRKYIYEGIAWYQRTVVIPKDFQNKHIELFLERSRSSRVWIDDNFVGESRLLQSPQKYDVSPFMTPGKHRITVAVDNRLSNTPYGNVHIYSDDTQTNWNGILGQLYLEASSRTRINTIQVYPDVSGKKIGVVLEIEKPELVDQFTVELQLEKELNGKRVVLPTMQSTQTSAANLRLEYDLAENCDFWDEFHRPLYRLRAKIRSGEVADERCVSFGMRQFEADGTQFAINGRKLFLRGKHEAAVFPLTGYPPMEVEGWQRVFRIAKEYGINHYRFHTYCPPEAAFEAADREGIYLQAELPFWGGLDSDTVADQLAAEGLAMLKSYANHPSFVLFSPGNEIWGGQQRVDSLIRLFKVTDPRPLYAMGSNNNIGYLPPRDYSDFFVGARVPEQGDSNLGHTRLTHAFADAREGGILNTQIPNTEVNFDFAVSHLSIPLISHEIGQYQIYPDYQEIEKYTGVLDARNLEVFRDRLKKAGMLALDSLFQQASGAWSALCYKAEMEAALRSSGMAGFQLLDLQDFPGQGTALVGILDAFMDSKGVISAEAWRQSCNDVVLLLEFPKYCWTNSEEFTATLQIANYSEQDINEPVSWELKRADGEVLTQGRIEKQSIPTGELTTFGSIQVGLGELVKAEKLQLNIALNGTDYTNSYPIWVYPSQVKIEKPKEILVTEHLDDNLRQHVEAGASLLLFPQAKDVKNTSIEGHFPPEFWNWGMFKTISENGNKPVSPGTLGLLMKPDHPIFRDFPTDFHTNWQWFSIIKASRSLLMDGTAADDLPLVQVIDNLERNHKLGLIFEYAVGKGKVVVCLSPLHKLQNHPEAQQLYRSILNYMQSPDFTPSHAIEAHQLEHLVYGE